MMLHKTLHLLALALLPLAIAQSQQKIVCGYDSSSYHREGSGKFLTSELEHALGLCTHLIYEHAVIDYDYRLDHKDPSLDANTGLGNYKTVTSLKKKYPGLRVLLSVGGWVESADSDRYLSLLRDQVSRGKFISSVASAMETYGFDGIDLAWQFPWVRVKQRSQLGSFWHKIKKTFGYAKGSKDLQADEHKAGFTELIKQLKRNLKPNGYSVTASVLPHTNYTLYWDLPQISPHLDAIHVHSFDYLTAEKNITPEVADYPAPLYHTYDRNPNFNVDTQIRWFTEHGAPSEKLILGIPAYGRTWRLDENSAPSGVPPIEANGLGAEGYLTKQMGIISHSEICMLLHEGNKTNTALRKMTDPSKKLGTYAWRSDNNDHEGFWVGYEDTNTARYKSEFAKKRLLGGVALYDLSMDDFRGVCSGERYPLLKAIKAGLT